MSVLQSFVSSCIIPLLFVLQLIMVCVSMYWHADNYYFIVLVPIVLYLYLIDPLWLWLNK